MEITWLGHAAFRLKAKEAVVVTDPTTKGAGYQMGKPVADIVTISSDDGDHSAFDLVGGTPRRLDASGEYELSGVLITGVRTKRKSGGYNTVFVIEMDEVRICHLGGLDHMPTAAEIETINEPDVLLVPAGGNGAFDGKEAAEVASLLGAHYVIPMRYRTEASGEGLDDLEGFLKATGQASRGEPQAKLTVTKSQVPEDLRVAVLDYKR